MVGFGTTYSPNFHKQQGDNQTVPCNKIHLVLVRTRVVLFRKRAIRDSTMTLEMGLCRSNQIFSSGAYSAIQENELHHVLGHPMCVAF